MLIQCLSSRKKENDHQLYKRQRNRTNFLVRRAKNKYHKELLKNSANNSQKFWNAVKSIYLSKEKGSIAKSFIIENETYSKPSDIATKFCTFFTNIANTLKKKAIPLRDFVWAPPFINYNKTLKSFNFSPVTVMEVFKHLKKLKRNKAAGVDNLPPGFLKDISVSVAKPLTHVINLCLLNGSLPDDFKIGKVTPVYKSGSKHCLDNYRPITVLSICSKILEKVIHSQLMGYLENLKLISKSQYGFRSKRSTELAVTLFTDNIRKNTDNGKLTGAIFIDLSKAFDTLGHNQIIANLSTYGIKGIEKEFFVNHLFNRKQQVCFENFSSNVEIVNCGVPQGSILGPLFFLLSFNYIDELLIDCKLIMYADDTVIYTSAKTIHDLQSKLQNDFQNVANWMISNIIITPGTHERDFQ